ncbi:uncharacterized protein LOC133174827 [Saccostrea echinata]|uniref:uncharacterized protein LOC133174827 n=1 Tax=Saccostrea echinata TaxID=191078 RepID=UPI002A811E44|nr:uncharacterized protein LOC133174827 [Saccostrea echinata]
MATPKQKEKLTKEKSKKTVSPGSDRTLRQRKIKVETEDEDSSYMSLDVLAQVASATLEKEPAGSKHKSPAKRITKRNVQNLEMFNLEQIQLLSERCLVNFFSKLTSNEITRNFIFTCALMPDKCEVQYKSFGNETQARLRMKKHLNAHIQDLLKEQKDPKNKNMQEFVAEPVHVKEKRQKEISGPKRKPTTGSKNYVYNRTSKPKRKRYTELDAQVPSDQNELVDEADVQMERVDGDDKESLIQQHFSERSFMLRKYAHKQSTRLQQKLMKKGETTKEVTIEGGEESDVGDDTEKRIEENEQFIIELLSRTQPHHDHGYTTIFGKKKGIEDIEFESNEEEVNDSTDYGQIYGKTGIIIHPDRKAEPILCLGNVSVMDELSSSGTSTDEASKTIIVCAEEIIDENPEEEINLVEGTEKVGDSGKRPYPPMPRFPGAWKGRIADDELYNDDEDFSMLRKRRKVDKEGSAEWERKAALKCIRELKGKKKDDKQPLYCRICKDKTFTASATLMYHYRSHAGIKPFVCLICNTTFTRQHSLNYHMLIHNNQSRFTCKDCGRKFRHPSHFKEHLRRHTGETPFVCTDCPQRFKTRNTYKRHLKTRHGKLLTADGIRWLSVEEFAKIRTKPYRRSPERQRRKSKEQTILPSRRSIDVEGQSDSDSSTISVTGDLDELVDIKLEMDQPLDLGENQADMLSEVQDVDDQDQKPVLDDLRKIIVPFGVNIAVNS